MFRFSSLGDVAMTVPVIRLLLQQHSQLTVTMVAPAFLAPLFEGIDRLDFYPADLKGKHKGVAGLYKLFKELQALPKIDAIADLHNVLRTKILCNFYRFLAKPIAVIDKGRKEKKALTRPKKKILRPLKSTFQRYADVFAQLQFPIDFSIEKGLSPKPSVPAEISRLKENGYRVIGIAPFAQYPEKTYPLAKMQEVIGLLTSDPKTAVFLFGGKAEREEMGEWERKFQNTYNHAGTGLQTELALIAHLDLMVSMDSANMHLASLYGVPVVSVWGGTHPYLGFMGWGQSLQNAVQIDLPCRPSSVFGNKPCPNNCACLEGISPQVLYEKILGASQQKT